MFRRIARPAFPTNIDKPVCISYLVATKFLHFAAIFVIPLHVSRIIVQYFVRLCQILFRNVYMVFPAVITPRSKLREWFPHLYGITARGHQNKSFFFLSHSHLSLWSIVQSIMRSSEFSKFTGGFHPASRILDPSKA